MTASATAEPTEAQMTDAIMEARKILGWTVAHFRPLRTLYGWRTGVQGDAAGFPDLVMIHERARLLWWVELKSKRGTLAPEQHAWRDLITAIGGDWRLVRGRAGLTELLDAMAYEPWAAAP